MNVIEAITSRKSVRAFHDQPVADELISQILDAAKWAPSSVNMQPWQVHVLRGAARDRLSHALVDACNNGEESNPDYSSYPKQWFEPYKSRRFACGKALYATLDIHYKDREKRHQHWLENFRFFRAPVELVILLDENVEKGSWLDVGMFLENIMLGAQEFDLATCSQASVAGYPDIVREILGVEDRYQVVCGVAIGYPNLGHPVNQYRTEREPLASFVCWHD